MLILVFMALFSLNSNAQETATEILQAAVEKAQLESKHVFVKYSASWCGWCKKMGKQLKTDPVKPLIDANYIIVDLVVNESKDNKNLETPGGAQVLKAQGGSNSGLPFWVILDDQGKVVENSFNDQGQNLGCPATQPEVEEFIKKLKNTSELTDPELETIHAVFVK